MAEVVGVVHLPRLPSVFYRPALTVERVTGIAVEEAKALEDIGYDGVIIENFGDSPYRKRVRDPLTLAAFTVVAREVRRSVSIRVGLNLLRNSGREAYAVAVAVGANFVRVNALTESVVTDSGLVEPEAPRIAPLRLNHPGVLVYADILVKHGGSLYLTSLYTSKVMAIAEGTAPEALREVILDAVDRGGADALVVTGLRTGLPPSLELVRLVKRLSPIPVVVGSGMTPENVGEYLRHADGVIVGSYIRQDGVAGRPLNRKRAEEFLRAARASSR